MYCKYTLVSHQCSQHSLLDQLSPAEHILPNFPKNILIRSWFEEYNSTITGMVCFHDQTGTTIYNYRREEKRKCIVLQLCLIPPTWKANATWVAVLFGKRDWNKKAKDGYILLFGVHYYYCSSKLPHPKNANILEGQTHLQRLHR